MTYDFEVNPELIRNFPSANGAIFGTGPRVFGSVQDALKAAEGRDHTTILIRAGTHIENCEFSGDGKVKLWGE